MSSDLIGQRDGARATARRLQERVAELEEQLAAKDELLAEETALVRRYGDSLRDIAQETGTPYAAIAEEALSSPEPKTGSTDTREGSSDG